MDHLTIFGLLALISTVIFDTLEKRNRWFILCFALGCVGAAYYGFASGAWPFGIVEGLWATIKVCHFIFDKRSLRWGPGWWTIGT